jgi:ferredoxin
MNRLLRYTRITIEAIAALLMTALLVDYSMGAAHIAGWLARIQFLPACLSVSICAIAFWLAATLIFGRVYCSSVCPMGALQDLLAHIPTFSTKRKLPYRHRRRFSRGNNSIRIGALCLFAACLLGVTSITSFIEPYTAYSRIAVYIIKPIAGSIENLVASLGEFTGLWTIAVVNVSVISITGLAIAAVTLIIIAYISVKHGRLFCNTLCPVGSALGVISRYSIFHMDIDTDKCINCHKCVRVCKAECIDGTDHVVDSSRCVVCFNCIDACNDDAIHYTTRRKRLSIPMMQRIKELSPEREEVATSGIDSNTRTGNDTSTPTIDRRRFLTIGTLALTSAIVAKAVKPEENKIKPIQLDNSHRTPIRHVTPPGATSRNSFFEHCTGCGLCISHCTSQVLRPATSEYGHRHPLVPVMDFDNAWCYQNCNRCTTLCPTGAIRPLTRDEKHKFVNGLASVELNDCISAAGSPCGACSRRCPTGAITMATNSDQSGMCPAIDQTRCIGCGACEYICPASPVKAIVINGKQ